MVTLLVYHLSLVKMLHYPIIEIILFLGAAQGMLLAAVLVSLKRGNRSAHRVLAVLLTLFSLMLFFHSSGEMQGIPSEKGSHDHFAQSIFALFSPLLYLYTRASTVKGFSLRAKDLLHGVPFLLCWMIFAALPFAPDRTAALRVTNGVLLVLFAIQTGIYYYYIFRLLGAHGRNIRSYFSSIEKIALQWLYFLVLGQAVIWPVAIIIEAAGGDSHTWNIVWLMMSAFIYAMGYFALRQPAVFTGIESYDPQPAAGTKKKYERSTLTAAEAKPYAVRLDDLMKTEKPYLSSELSLPELAKRVGLSTHHLSQVLNETLGINFFDYVNGYRVEEAKRLLVKPEVKHYSIAAIGFEAGFNSLSAFNSVFKKRVGMTPSKFRASV